jgi:mono/diheme cytochrome c family protein
MLGDHPPNRIKVLMPVFAVVAALGLSVNAAPMPAETIGEDLLASVVRGGRLYDNWFEETRVKAHGQRHPAYPSAAPGTPADTWRCAACHGWDYRGADGAFSRGEHYTGIKGIRALVGADPQRVIAVMRDETHGYTDTMLGPRDFADLAAFVTRGQVNMNRSIDRATGKAKGDATRNEDFYKIVCANCHGRAGLKLRTMAPLGKVASDNPWETLHKIRNGQPDEKMPALRALPLKISVDILAYAVTLPK